MKETVMKWNYMMLSITICQGNFKHNFKFLTASDHSAILVVAILKSLRKLFVCSPFLSWPNSWFQCFQKVWNTRAFTKLKYHNFLSKMYLKNIILEGILQIWTFPEIVFICSLHVNSFLYLLQIQSIFFYKQHFYKQRQAETGKKSSKR